MKKKNILIKLLLILLIIAVIIIAFWVGKMSSNFPKASNIVKKIDDVTKFKNEYETLNDEATDDGNKYSTVNINTNISIIYIDLEQLNQLLNSEEAIIYVGSPSCPFCRTSIELLLKSMEDLKLKKLYYYNGSVVNSQEENYNEIMDELVNKNIVKVRENGIKSFGKPLVINVKDSEIVSITRGVTYELEEDNQSMMI